MDQRNYIGAGLVAAVLVAVSVILPPSSPDSRAKASPVIPAMLLQTIGEAENQCRITQDSCMIKSDRCKAGHDTAIRRHDQCKAGKEREYRACYDRVYQTVRPAISSGNRQRVVEWKQQQARRQCQYLKDTRRSCPKPQDRCYSRGYCIQQYQRCSSNAYLEDQSYNQRGTPQPTEQTEQYTSPPPPRTAPRRPSGPVSGLPWNDKRPYVYQVKIENTCKHPVKASYGISDRNGLRSYGWKVLNRGMNTVSFPENRAVGVNIFLKQGELASVRARGKLVVYEHNKHGYGFYLKDDDDFDLDHYKIYTSTPPKPGYRIARFAMLAQGFHKTAKRYKIIKCRTKR